MATTIATGALPPRVAVAIAAILNFVGRVHLAEGGRDGRRRDRRCGSDHARPSFFGGLIGAICWNLATWWFGLPSSSSHALIGGVVGATLAAAGTSAVEVQRARVQGHRPGCRVADRRRPRRRDRRLSRLPDDPPLRPGSVRARVSLGAGRVVVDGRARARHQRRPEDDGRDLAGADRQRLDLRRRQTSTCPSGSSSSCATAIALGTYAGGWRIIKTLGTKVVEVRPPQGFGSETVAATVILASSHVGYPLSTTQVVSGAVAGSGVGRPGAVGRLARSRARSSPGGCSRCRRRPPWQRSSTRSSSVRRRRRWNDRGQRGHGRRRVPAVACQPGPSGRARGGCV